MPSTWKLYSYRKHGELATLTIQEFVDGVPDNIYTATTHHKHSNATFIKILLDVVRKSRMETETEKIAMLEFDITNFEASLRG